MLSLFIGVLLMCPLGFSFNHQKHLVYDVTLLFILEEGCGENGIWDLVPHVEKVSI